NGESKCELHALSSACYDILNIESATGPLIFTYAKQKPEIRYPIIIKNDFCLFFSSNDKEQPNIRLYLSCPGHNLSMNFELSTYVLSIHTTFLTAIDGDFNVHSFGKFSASYLKSIRCTEEPVHIMNKVSEVNLDKMYYSVGFMINAIHFLTVYRLFRSIKLKSHVYVRVVSVIQEKPKFDKLMKEYKIGQIYENKKINYTIMYQTEFQVELFKNILGNENKFVEIYFSDGNYVDKGHLINKDDLFYNAQQISTYYYENTIPICDSINKGNWDLVSKIVRNLADETVTDMEVSTLSLNDLSIDDIRFDNRRMYNQFKIYHIIRIPRLLIKIVYSSLNATQEVVFHTANDPYMTEIDMYNLMYNRVQPENGLCRNLGLCRDEYPQFLDAKKGLTYC
ncbi:hypothetical protein TSAR_014488, partial [Trichomalopsis sarcophagae]